MSRWQQYKEQTQETQAPTSTTGVGSRWQRYKQYEQTIPQPITPQITTPKQTETENKPGFIARAWDKLTSKEFWKPNDDLMFGKKFLWQLTDEEQAQRSAMIQERRQQAIQSKPDVGFLGGVVGGAYLTVLNVNPDARNKFIADNPELVTNMADNYDKYIGGHLRTALPSKIALATAEKVVGRQLAATYDEIREKYPVAATISGLTGDIYNLALTQSVLGSLGILSKVQQAQYLGPTSKFWFPFAERFVPNAVSRGMVWGTKGFLDEVTDQFQAGDFNPTKLASETGKDVLFGTLLAAPMATTSTVLQVGGSGLVFGGLTALEKYLEDGTLTADDMLDVGASTILGMALAAFGVKGRVGANQSIKVNNYAKLQLESKVGTEAATKILQAQSAEQLAKLFPNNQVKEVAQMAKNLYMTGVKQSEIDISLRALAKSKPEYADAIKTYMSLKGSIGLPILSTEPTYQVTQTIKEQFTALPQFQALSADMQSNLINTAIDNVMSAPEIGKPVVEEIIKTITNSIQQLPTSPVETPETTAQTPTQATPEQSASRMKAEGKTFEEFVKSQPRYDITSDKQLTNLNKRISEEWANKNYKEVNNLSIVKQDLLSQKYDSLLRNKRTLAIGPCEGTCVNRTDIPFEQGKAFDITNPTDFDFFARKINQLEGDNFGWDTIEINDRYLIATESGIERIFPIGNAEQFVSKPIEVYSKTTSQLKDIWDKAQDLTQETTEQPALLKIQERTEGPLVANETLETIERIADATGLYVREQYTQDFKELARNMLGTSDLTQITQTQADLLLSHLDDILEKKIIANSDIADAEMKLLQLEEIGAKERVRGTEPVFDKIGLSNDPMFTPDAIMTRELDAQDEYLKFDARMQSYKESVANIPGQETRIFRHLDGHKDYPLERLSEAEQRVAEWARKLLNEWADRIKLPADKRRKNYITHILEQEVEQSLREKSPLPAAFFGALKMRAPKQIFNPYIRQRLGREIGVKEDVWEALKAYISKQIKVYHYSPLIEKLNAYKQYAPPNTARYLDEFTKRLTSEPLQIDKEIKEDFKDFASFLRKSGMEKIATALEKGNPGALMTHMYTGILYEVWLGLRPVSAIKNLSQQGLSIAEVGLGNYMKGKNMQYTKQGKELLKESVVMRSRQRGFFLPASDAALVKQMEGKRQRVTMAMFKAADKDNVSAGFLSGYYEAKSLGVPHEVAIKRGDEVARKTQYVYTRLMSAELNQSSLGRLLTVFTSWPRNWAELMNHWIKGKPSKVYLEYGKSTGKPVKGYTKLGEHDEVQFDKNKKSVYRYLFIVMLGFLIERSTKLKGSYYTGWTSLGSLTELANGNIPGLNIPGSVLGIIGAMSVGDTDKAKRHWRNLSPARQVILIRELQAILDGKKTWLDLFLYLDNNKDDSPSSQFISPDSMPTEINLDINLKDIQLDLNKLEIDLNW